MPRDGFSRDTVLQLDDLGPQVAEDHPENRPVAEGGPFDCPDAFQDALFRRIRHISLSVKPMLSRNISSRFSVHAAS